MAIFGSSASAPKFFQSGKATATIGDTKAMLLQVTVQFTRTIAPIQTINEGIAFAASLPTGTLSADSILANSKDLVNMLEGGGCMPYAMNINMNATCDASDVTLDLTGLYFQSVQFSLTGQTGYVGENVQAVFSGLAVNQNQNLKLGDMGSRTLA